MSERPIPEDVMAMACHEAQFFADWLHHGNSTGSLSEHAIAGLADSIARAIMAERERCAKIMEGYPPREFFGILYDIASASQDMPSSRVFEGDTGNWAWLIGELLKPYVEQMRGARQ